MLKVIFSSIFNIFFVFLKTKRILFLTEFFLKFFFLKNHSFSNLITFLKESLSIYINTASLIDLYSKYNLSLIKKSSFLDNKIYFFFFKKHKNYNRYVFTNNWLYYFCKKENFFKKEQTSSKNEFNSFCKPLTYTDDSSQSTYIIRKTLIFSKTKFSFIRQECKNIVLLVLFLNCVSIFFTFSVYLKFKLNFIYLSIFLCVYIIYNFYYFFKIKYIFKKVFSLF